MILWSKPKVARLARPLRVVFVADWLLHELSVAITAKVVNSTIRRAAYISLSTASIFLFFLFSLIPLQ